MIELVTTWDALVNALGAGAMLAFGAWVFTLTPRTRTTKMLAVFAIAAGAAFITVNLVRFTGWHDAAIRDPLVGVGLSVGGLALLGLVREMLDPLEGRARRLWHLALAVTASGAFSFLVAALIQGPPGGGGPGQGLTVLLSDTAVWLFFAAFLGLALVLARRYRHPPEDREEATRTQAVLVSAALVLWPAFVAGWSAASYTPPDAVPAFTPPALLLFGGFLVVAGLWLVNARAVPERSREGRNVALLTLAMLLAGMLQAVFVDPHFSSPALGPLWGVVRLATVVALGYAILRHEVLGIEAKFRFGISKTTVAGVFVAVFFVVSEGAQVLFAGVVGSQILGIIAAGALLFALAPIQKMADRIAKEVVPGGAGGTVGDDREHRYRDAVRVALADGEITREEERELASQAKALGLDPQRALELREQVEDEMSGGDTP